MICACGSWSVTCYGSFERQTAQYSCDECCDHVHPDCHCRPLDDTNTLEAHSMVDGVWRWTWPYNGSVFEIKDGTPHLVGRAWEVT